MSTKKRAWIASALFGLFIFLSAVAMPAFTEWLRRHHLLKIVLLASSVFFLSYILFYFVSRLKIRSVWAYVGIGLLLLFAAPFLLLGNHSIEERVHVLEYTLMALLLFKACKFSFKGVLLYALPFLLAVAIGWAEELWQGLLPNRVYDILDVYKNAAGAFVGIGLAWLRQTYSLRVD